MYSFQLSTGLTKDYPDLNLPSTNPPDFVLCYADEYYDQSVRARRERIVLIVKRLSDVIHEKTCNDKEILDAISKRELELYGEVININH